MKFTLILTVAIGLLSIVGCKKEEEAETEPLCDCYERHEEYVNVATSGLPSYEYVLDYNGATYKADCATETGTYVPKSSGFRYIVICD